MAIIERKRLEWSAQGLARSPVWMLQSDDRPNRTALNSLHDKDGQRNCCHSALGHLTLPKGATTWGIPVKVFKVCRSGILKSLKVSARWRYAEN